MRSVKEIETDISECQTKLRGLFHELSEVRQANTKEKSDSYEKRKALLEETSKIFEKLVKEGDYVKVTGSRAGSYRMVKEIAPGSYNHWGGWMPGELIGATCAFNDRTKKITKVYQYNIITCGTNKITAILRDDKWITAKEIFEMKEL